MSGRRIRASTVGCVPRSWSRTCSPQGVGSGGTAPFGPVLQRKHVIARMIVAQGERAHAPHARVHGGGSLSSTTTPPRWAAEHPATLVAPIASTRVVRSRPRSVRCAVFVPWTRSARSNGPAMSTYRGRAPFPRPARDHGRTADHRRAPRADAAFTATAGRSTTCTCAGGGSGASTRSSRTIGHSAGQGAGDASPDLSDAAARRNLRVTLTYLQSVLEPDRLHDEPPFYLSVDQERIRFAGSAPRVARRPPVRGRGHARRRGHRHRRPRHGNRRVRARAPAVAGRLSRGVP